MPFVKVGEENSGNINLYYEDHGEGKPVVLIHGWPLNGRSWEKQIAVLLEAGYRVIAYDRRGFGTSSRPSKGYDYDTFASDLNLLMNFLDLRDATLVGFSMGTGEVCRYLGKYGDSRVQRAVLIASVPPFLLKTPENPEGVDEKIFEDIKENIRKDRPAYLAKFLSDFYNLDQTMGKRISEEVVNLSWNVAAMASPKGTLDCVSAWVEDFREDLPKIKVPVLVIHGDADRILPIQSTGDRLAKDLKGSKYVKIKDAPHGLIWTHAEDVNRALMEFMGTAEVDYTRRPDRPVDLKNSRAH